MLKKFGQIILITIGSFLAAILQFSLVSSLPGFFNEINLGLILMIFVLFFFDVKAAYIFVLIFGFCLDILSFRFFGFYTISLGITALLSYFILENWLTNKSLYSFWALFLEATFVYCVIGAILSSVALGFENSFPLFSSSFWIELFYQASWSIIFSALLFNISTALAKRYKPFFLEKNGSL